ncbi:hypothetical protein Tco_0519990 [Tanacetum coccineum]
MSHHTQGQIESLRDLPSVGGGGILGWEQKRAYVSILLDFCPRPAWEGCDRFEHGALALLQLVNRLPQAMHVVVLHNPWRFFQISLDLLLPGQSLSPEISFDPLTKQYELRRISGANVTRRSYSEQEEEVAALSPREGLDSLYLVDKEEIKDKEELRES